MTLAAAAALFVDADGRVLLVKPTYRDHWLLPGGGVEADEYPLAAACREVKEELGLDLQGSACLVAVDWTHPRPDSRALVVFVFDGGQLRAGDAAHRIRLPPDELSDWAFVAAADWGAYVPDRIVRRLRACQEALLSGATVYLQDGSPPSVS